MSKPAYYMVFSPGHLGAADRVGGLPSHLPPEFPRNPRGGGPMAFLAQFACDAARLPLPGAAFIQLYQNPDPSEPPDMRVVVVPAGAPPNGSGLGLAARGVEPHDVTWERRDDPDVFPEPDPNDFGDLPLYKSKVGGVFPFTDNLPDRAVPVLQLSELPAGFNFAGMTAVIYFNGRGELEAALA